MAIRGIRWRLLWLGLAASLALGAGGDPGIVIEVDRESFLLSARDLRSGESGPELRVTTGSPRHETPAGSYPLYTVILDPAWEPGAQARGAGARPQPSRIDGPLGVAKLPFGDGGYAIHGAAHPLLLGKPVSLGCVRADDGELLGLLDWLRTRRALGRPVPKPSGERHQALLRPARILIR